MNFSQAKKVLCILLGLVLLFGMTMAAEAAQTRIKISLDVPKDHECYARFEEFGRKVNADTDNAFRFELYPSSQLGDYTLVTEEVIRGNVEMLVGSVNTGVDSRFDLTFTPYLANGLDDVANVFGPGSFVYEKDRAMLAENGMVMLGFDVIGMGGISFGNKIPADPYAIGGGGSMLCRSPGNEHVRVFLSEMGYNPTSVNWSEIYTSVQTGVIDCFVGAVASNAWLQFRDVIKAYAPIDIWAEVQYIVFSEKIWKELTPAQQAVFEKHAAELFLQSIEETRATDDGYYKQLQEAGIQVIFPKPGDLDRMAQMARQKAWPAAERRLGTELYHELMDHYGLSY